MCRCRAGRVSPVSSDLGTLQSIAERPRLVPSVKGHHGTQVLGLLTIPDDDDCASALAKPLPALHEPLGALDGMYEVQFGV